MAASSIATPGSEYGPCVDRLCGHADCEANRQAAECICRICNQPIGYDTKYYDEWYDHENARSEDRYAYGVHFLCFHNEIAERNANAKAKAVPS